MSEESIRTLHVLNESHGRLHGRFDRNVPFLRTDPNNPDPNCRLEVPFSIANELFEAGFIGIDEAAPIAEIYTFMISYEGRQYLATN